MSDNITQIVSEKLDKSNFHAWKFRMTNFLMGKGVWDIVTGSDGVTLQFCIWNILEYISQLLFKMDGFDVLKVLGKIYVGRKILVFVHYGVGLILQLDFELVREIIWRNSIWESFRSWRVEKLCPSEKFVVHSFSRLYGGQKLLTKWFWAKSDLDFRVKSCRH